MKKFDKKYLYWGLTGFLTLASAILFYYILFHGVNFIAGMRKLGLILSPIIYGCIIAYLINPVVVWCEETALIPLYRKLKGLNKEYELNNKEKKIFRNTSLVLAFLFFYIILYALLSMVIPQLISSIENIIYNLPLYANNLGLWAMGLTKSNPELENTIMQAYYNYSDQAYDLITENLLPQAQNIVKNLSTKVLGSVILAGKIILNLIIGLIVSIYLICSKEKFAGQAKKILFAFMDFDDANITISNFRFIHNTFIGFLSGKILDSFIIGIICYICTSLLSIPYAMVVSVIVGITNIIPFFGPYLGAIPSALLILMVNPKQCLVFIIFILILQQIDGNIIGPKILGDSTGLSSFWVIFAITVFGGIFGIFGMIIGVPVFAVIFAAVKTHIEKKLIDKNLPTETEKYTDVESIESNSVVNKVKRKSYKRKPNKYYKNNQNTNEADDYKKNTWKQFNKKNKDNKEFKTDDIKSNTKINNIDTTK